MNARQAVLENDKLVIELYENSVNMSERTGKTVEECIDHKVNFYVRKSKSTNEELAWENRGIEAKKLIPSVESYDINFNDDENYKNKEFKVIAIVKEEEVTTIISANTKEDAIQKAMKELGYEINGNFYPLHRTEIKFVKRIKNLNK